MKTEYTGTLMFCHFILSLFSCDKLNIIDVNVLNGLPSDVTSASSLAVFKNTLKTYLFRCCYETV